MGALSKASCLFFASFTGPLRTVQIVLRGHAFVDSQVRWSLERMEGQAAPDGSADDDEE